MLSRYFISIEDNWRTSLTETAVTAEQTEPRWRTLSAAN
jgi:hypothetical protein